MNESTNASQAPGSTDQPADFNQTCGSNPHHAHTHTQSGSCAFDPLTRAISEGFADAKKAAQDAIPILASALSKGAYHAAYGFSFAAAFPIAFLRHVCPDTIKSGVNEGLSKGMATGESFAECCQRRSQAAPAQPNAPADSTADAATPA